MNFKCILFAGVAGFLMIEIFFFKPVKIYGIYQDTSFEERWGRECQSTVVLVDNSPVTKNNLFKLWERERGRILNQWNPLNNKCDYILFINNKPEPPHDSEEIKYWIGDYQICLKGEAGNCISKDERLFYIGIDKQIYGNKPAGEFSNKKLYISFVD